MASLLIASLLPLLCVVGHAKTGLVSVEPLASEQSCGVQMSNRPEARYEYSGRSVNYTVH